MTPSSIEDAVKQGLEHHRAGRLAEAERLYRQVLAADPNHPDGLHLMGVLALNAGQVILATELLSRAVAVNGSVPEFHWNLGRALAGCGRLGDACVAYERALRIRPEFAEVWNDLGNAIQIGGQWRESIAAYEKAIALKPDLTDAWNNMASAQIELGEFDSAIRSLGHALELRPNYPEAANNLGNAYQSMGKVEDALREYDRAIAMRGDYGRVYGNKGRALRSLGRHDEAMAAFRKAIELSPNHPDGHNSLASGLLDELKIEESIANFHRALELNPNFPEAHHNLGRVLLLRGEYDAGWKEYEWRWGMKDVIKSYPQLRVPLWNPPTALGPEGEELSNVTILLHAEQGFGDTIQFIRYAPLVKARGARVVVAVQPVLGRLLKGCEGIDHVVLEGEAVPKVDARCPLMSLPRIFGTTVETIPSQRPYLKVEDEIVRRWREKLSREQAPRIGLVWAGRPTHQEDRLRSLRFTNLWPALRMEGRSYHSLQVGAAAQQLDPASGVKDWSGELTDFAETAGLLMNLDLVITADTAVAHLAGALGRKVWVMVQYSPDWRWMLGREDSPWYPTMRLFRQEKPGDWAGVVQRVFEAMTQV